MMRSLRWQLVVSHLLPVLVMALVLAAAISGFISVRRSIDSVLRTNMETVAGTQGMSSSLEQQQTAFALLLAGNGPEAAQLQNDSWRNFTAAYSSATARQEDTQTGVALNLLWIQANVYEHLASTVMARNQAQLRPETKRVVRQIIQPTLKSLQDQAAKVLKSSDLAFVNENHAARQKADNWSIRIFLCTIIAIGLAIWFARRLVTIALTPLAMLARQAESIAEGNLNVKSNLLRKDEIGALADSFDAMASKLAEARKGEERRLHRLEALTDAALESLLDPVIVTDSKLRIAHLNRSAQGLFGPIPSSPRRPLADHIHDRRIVSCIDRAVAQDMDLHPDDERLLVPIKIGTEERIYRLRINVMHVPEGSILGSVTVLEDVTYLRTLDRMKTEFIGVAAHELRTPITSLLLSAQLLGEGAAGPLNENQAEIIRAQEEELIRLERVIEELLDLTKLEAGTTPPRLELISVSELVRQPIQTIRPQALAKGITLEVDVPENLGKVRADPGQIGRVLTNLLANAIRHTGSQGIVTLRASASKYDVTLHVGDTGEGIPVEYVDRIFERFVQVPGATRGGAGLGLSISNRIVQSHGGNFSVKSEVGKGSEFCFTLPKEGEATGGENTV
jgi:signal transduction histidine kinase